MMAVKESSASKIKFKGVDALFGLSEEQECVRETGRAGYIQEPSV